MILDAIRFSGYTLQQKLKDEKDFFFVSFTSQMFSNTEEVSRDKRNIPATTLTFSWWRTPSNRNQSIDMQSKSVDLFLYDKDLCRKELKRLACGATHFVFFLCRGVLRTLWNSCQLFLQKSHTFGMYHLWWSNCSFSKSC